MWPQAGRRLVGYLVFLALPVVSWAHISEDPASLNTITINHYGNCSQYSEELEQRVSQLEQTVVDLIEARGQDRVIIRDCSEVSGRGNRSDGVYTLRPTNSQSPFPVYCQFDEDGAWTVIQRRVDASVDFHRSWIEYKNGFGVMDSNFWLGNDNIHTLTNQRQMTLRIEIADWDDETRHADYRLFRIDGNDALYRLRFAGYSGTAGDSLEIHNNMEFSTVDEDNDNNGRNCAESQTGGWWFNKCDNANLNGMYSDQPVGKEEGIEWHTWKPVYSFRGTVMKIKPAFHN